MVYVHKYKNKIDTSTDISYAPNTDYPHVSRYAILRKIKNQKGNVSYLETQNARYPEDSSMDQYHVVSPGEENRLIVLSLRGSGIHEIPRYYHYHIRRKPKWQRK